MSSTALVAFGNSLDRVARAASCKTVAWIERCAAILQLDDVIGEQTNAVAIEVLARQILAVAMRAADHDAAPLGVLTRRVDWLCSLRWRYCRAGVDGDNARGDARDLRHPACSK